MFSFNIVIYKQRDGVSIGSSVGSCLDKCDYDRTGKVNIANIDRVWQVDILYEIYRWQITVS